MRERVGVRASGYATPWMRFREHLVRPGTKERRRQLRREATDAEAVLWRHLRDSCLGAKFRRQHSIGPFIVDFYCCAARLVIELDGGQHYEATAVEHDRWRTAELARHGARVIRFPNDEVLRSPEVVLTVIAEVLDAAPERSASPHPHPLPHAGEGAEPRASREVRTRFGRRLGRFRDV